MSRLVAVVFLALLALTSCAGDTSGSTTAEPAEVRATLTVVPAATADPTATPELTVTPEPTASPEPTVTPEPIATLQPTVTPEPTATPTPVGWIDGQCFAPPRAAPREDRPVYVAELRIDDAARQVTGSTEITFTPDLPTDRIVLRLWPNGPREANAGSSMQLSNLRLDGEPAVAAPGQDPSRVTIDLGSVLNAGTSITISADFTLAVGVPAKARTAMSDDWVRLGSALPLLAWEPGVGWAEEPGTAQFAEAVTSTSADWTVDVTAPERFTVLASGTQTAAPVTSDGFSRTTWTAQVIRDFALSAGVFTVHERVVAAPDPVLLRVGISTGIAESAVAYADRLESALVDFSQRYGDYPWPTLTVGITPGIGGGIEFPTHIMLGNGTIGRTTPHEVAHMFFYSLVGNNQARDPWIDEGLASWAEFVHEGRDPATFGLTASPNAGQSMAWFAGRSDYYTNAYQQPAVALARLGSVAEVDCALRILVARQAFGIATNADVLNALAEVFGSADVDAVFTQYGITE